jgi:hypothetical protein
MPLYPVPVLVALSGWIFILLSSGRIYIGAGIAVVLLGIVAYLWRARQIAQWPWESGERAELPRTG